MAKPEKLKVTPEIQEIQQDLKNLQEAIGKLVDAMITEAKPDFSEIKKLQALKKSVLNDCIVKDQKVKSRIVDTNNPNKVANIKTKRKK